MGRQLRIFMPGFAYHIVARGNERKEIFRDDGDRLYFLKLIEKAKERFGFSVLSYCLMTNHYHLLVEVSAKNMSAAMQYINGRYSCYFNHKHNRCGHLYQGRFFAGIVEHGPEIKFVTAYIHLNPARAYMVKELNTYLWSSHRQFTGAAGGGIAVPELVLKYFSDDRAAAVKKYEEYLAEAAKTDDNSNKARLYDDYVLGTESFMRDIKLLLKDKDLDKDIIKRRKLRRIYEENTIISCVADFYSVGRELLLYKKTKWNKGKSVLIYLLQKDGGKNFSEIGKLLGGLYPGGVGRVFLRMEKRIEKEKKYRAVVDEIRKKYGDSEVCQVSGQGLTPVFSYDET